MSSLPACLPHQDETILERFQHALSTLVPHSADELELCLLGRAGEYTRFAKDRIHQPQDITETQILIRAVCDGHASRTTTTTLSRVPDAAAAAAAAAQILARRGTTGSTSLPAPTQDANAHTAPLWFDDTVTFDHGTRTAAAYAAMRAANRVGGDAFGMFGRAVVQQVVATSTGIRQTMRATEATGSLTVVVQDGTAHWVDLSRSADRLDSTAAVDDTVERAVASQQRKALDAGRYTVVLGPEAAGEMLQFLPAFGFSGELAAAGVGVCATAPNVQLASELVTVADDGGADVGLPTPFDIEGVSKRRVPMLSRGRVGQPITDTATAHRLGAANSTGHAHIGREEPPATQTANIIMAAGPDDEDSLIGNVDTGVYIERFWYTRLVDPTASTITGVTRDGCFRIQGGQLTTSLPGMRFTQSVLGFLATVDGVGDTLRSQPIMNVWNGASTAPTIRGRNFALGTPANR